MEKLGDFSKRALMKDLLGLQETIRNQKNEISKPQASIEKYNQMLKIANTELGNNEIKYEKVMKNLILFDDFSEEFVQRRNSLLLVKGKLNSKDITIRESETLAQTEKELLSKLPKLCRHRLLVGHCSYQGSHLNDYDDAYPGCRWCVLCDLIETDHRESGKRTYPTLNLNGERVLWSVSGSRFDSEFSQLRNSFWIPIAEILMKFQEAIKNGKTTRLERENY